MILTGVLTIGLKVLTSSEQAEQGTGLVRVLVEPNAVLVLFKGGSKTGCTVVHDDWACT